MSAHELLPLGSRISVLFRSSVWISAIALAAGLGLFFAGSPAGPAVLNTGLVLLMATPAARIVMCLADAVRRRDLTLVAATAGVLILLAALLARRLAH